MQPIRGSELEEILKNFPALSALDGLRPLMVFADAISGSAFQSGKATARKELQRETAGFASKSTTPYPVPPVFQFM
jgi:hypothetical protein